MKGQEDARLRDGIVVLFFPSLRAVVPAVACFLLSCSNERMIFLEIQAHERPGPSQKLVPRMNLSLFLIGLSSSAPSPKQDRPMTTFPAFCPHQEPSTSSTTFDTLDASQDVEQHLKGQLPTAVSTSSQEAASDPSP